MNFRRNFCLLILIMISVAGCTRIISKAPPKPDEALYQVNVADIDLADDLDKESLDLAIERSLKYYDGRGHNNIYHIADRTFTADQMKESLYVFREIIKNNVSTEEKRKLISEKFNIFRAAGQNGDGGVLFTGYYEPMLNGSLTRTDKYKYPLYKTPSDLMAKKISKNETRISRMANGESVPYYSRLEIDAGGVLQGKGLELIWVDDPADLFFLHIQGSGKIKLDDGTLLTVSFAQTNGRPFRSITRFMLDSGKISGSEASFRNFKRFLRSKPDEELYEIMGYNESYIFFRFVDKDPIGSLGEPITPGRSIATDPDMFPQGALAFISLRKPVFDQDGNMTSQRVNFSRFVLNQDKGSAIKGSGRVDLFCGYGEDAEAMASTLKENGELYFLIKK